jgi:toxin ParE1/3/4
MIQIHQQAKAKQDLKKIWLYTFQQYGEQQADKYFDNLIVAIKTLSQNPSISTPCNYIRSGYRQYHINQHCIFYRLGKNKIHITRVLHQSMQFTKHLR